MESEWNPYRLRNLGNNRQALLLAKVLIGKVQVKELNFGESHPCSFLNFPPHKKRKTNSQKSRYSRLKISSDI